MPFPYDIDDPIAVNDLFDEMTAPQPRLFSSPGSNRFRDEVLANGIVRTVSVAHDLLTVHSVHTLDNATVVCTVLSSPTPKFNSVLLGFVTRIPCTGPSSDWNHILFG